MRLLEGSKIGAATLLGLLGWVSSGAGQTYAAPNLPLRFEPNLGQADSKVEFLSRGVDFLCLVTAQGATLIPRSSESVDLDLNAPGGPREAMPQSEYRGVVRMRFVGASPTPEFRGEERMAGRSHYFLGVDPTRWVTEVPAYRRVSVEEVYPGIDFVYYGNGNRLEFDVKVDAGAHPEAVELEFEGADGIEIDREGTLLVRVGEDELRLLRPYAYQERDRIREEIVADFVLSGRYRVRFQVAEYDATQPMVIDPIISYSTYLGGAQNDFARAVAVDAEGFAYVTGSTMSVDFPVAGASPSPPNGSVDAFVAKLDPSGSELVYSAYLGGELDDLARGVSLDAAGNIYITGQTASLDFPTRNAFQPRLAGQSDAFVAKLNPTGSELSFSTYLGGSGFDAARGAAVDGFGSIALMGQTDSVDFPTKNARQQHLAGSMDAFVAKLDPSGSALVFSSYHGGSRNDLPYHIVDCAETDNFPDSPGWGVAVDAAGFVYVAGTTESTDFPTFKALQPFHRGGRREAFVSKFDPFGTLVYSTFLGGGSGDSARGIAVDAVGNAYVAGATKSSNFPITAEALQTEKGELYDAFVTKIDSNGAAILYSTFLGGDSDDAGGAIAVDSLGNAVVVGLTQSHAFPIKDAIQPVFAGSQDLFLAKLEPDGSALNYSTYLGGSRVETPCSGMGVALDAVGSAYLVGSTGSDNFPVTDASFQRSRAGGYDALLTKVRTEPEVEVQITVIGSSYQLVVNVNNPGTKPRQVEMKVWIASPVLGPRFSLVPVPFQLTLPPTHGIEVFDVPLPSALAFPGTTVGAKLIDPVTGLTLSESECAESPCPEAPTVREETAKR